MVRGSQIIPEYIFAIGRKKSHIENNEMHVEEVAVIRALSDGKEALDELMKAKGDVFVFHTKHEKVIMPIRAKPAYRGKVVQ